MRTLKILGAGAALLAAGGPALATHGGVHPTFRTEQAYMHCAGTTKVGNVNLVVDDAIPTWDTIAPTKSVRDGAGCGTVGSGNNSGTYMENIYDAVFVGDFTGNLDSLTIQLHNIYVGGARNGADMTVQVRLTVDGASVFGTRETTTTTGDKAQVPQARTITLRPKPSSTGASGLVEFTIAGLGYGTQNGDGSAVRSLQLTIDTTEPVNGWVYDVTEAPSGIVFNPATPAEKVLTATTPGPAAS